MGVARADGEARGYVVGDVTVYVYERVGERELFPNALEFALSFDVNWSKGLREEIGAVELTIAVRDVSLFSLNGVGDPVGSYTYEP